MSHVVHILAQRDLIRLMRVELEDNYLCLISASILRETLGLLDATDRLMTQVVYRPSLMQAVHNIFTKSTMPALRADFAILTSKFVGASIEQYQPDDKKMSVFERTYTYLAPEVGTKHTIPEVMPGSLVNPVTEALGERLSFVAGQLEMAIPIPH